MINKKIQIFPMGKALGAKLFNLTGEKKWYNDYS